MSEGYAKNPGKRDKSFLKKIISDTLLSYAGIVYAKSIKNKTQYWEVTYEL